MKSNPKYTIKFHKTEILDKNYYTFFDAKGGLLYPPGNYLMYMMDTRQSSLNTVINRASTMRVFFQYLSDNDIDYLDVDDAILEKYRDKSFVTSKAGSNTQLNKLQRSINVYLRQIYDFYKWVQEQEPRKNILGIDGCQIYSTLINNQYEKKNHFPKCYSSVGEHSKHTVNFVPSHEDYTDLFSYFLQQRPDAGARNTLILRIFRDMGLRVGSLASLTIQQFDESKIRKHGVIIEICPAVQKGGYSKKFEVPEELFYAIVNYIKKERQQIVDKFQTSSDRLFLSSTKGIPLESNRISQIFLDAAKKIGWNDDGVGPHCWRRFFACETIENDIDSSIELGLDTSIEGIGLRTAQKLGHNSILSQEAYIRSLKRAGQETATSRLANELKFERDKNDSQAIEIAELRRMLEKK